MRATIGFAALVVIGLPCGVSAQSGDPLTGRLKSKADSLCFSRSYDAAHLKRNPGQATRAAMLSFKQDAVRIMLDQKGRDGPIYVLASCEWDAQANRDIGGRRLLKSFTKEAGYNCIVLVAPESAEEGGYAVLDPAPDARTVTLHIDSPARARPSLERAAQPFSLNLGRDDRVFRMSRTDPSACKAMEDAIEAP